MKNVTSLSEKREEEIVTCVSEGQSLKTEISIFLTDEGTDFSTSHLHSSNE